MVNKESKDSTIKFFAKRKKIKLPSVPFVTSDTKLHEYFPYDGYPYQVWIDSTLKVRFITESYNATEKHIKDFLAGEQVVLDSLTRRIFSGPVIQSANKNWIEGINYYSLISPCIAGLNIGYTSGLEEGNKVSLRSNCSSIAELFKKAFEEDDRYEFRLPSKIIIEPANISFYGRPKDANLIDDWQKAYSYNYELGLPPERRKELYRFMQDDVQRYFGVEAFVEKRKIKCLALIRTGTLDKLRTSGGTPENKLWLNSIHHPIEEPMRYLKNIPFKDLIFSLKAWVEHATQLPFADETGYKGNIDIGFKGDVYDSFKIDDLVQELRQYGLDIIEKERPMDVLVLRSLQKELNPVQEKPRE
jgi:hypothetical protein